jgi:rubrerythrin
LSEHEKTEALNLLNQQLKTEKKLVEMYEETAPLIMSEPAKWLLHILQMDSRKHIAIFDMAVKILEGQRIGDEDRQEITVGLEKHLELEAESIERSKKIRANRWVKENSGLSRLMETWSSDERRHVKTLQRLRDERFTRMDAFDAYTEYRRTAFKELADEIKKLANR